MKMMTKMDWDGELLSRVELARKDNALMSKAPPWMVSSWLLHWWKYGRYWMLRDRKAVMRAMANMESVVGSMATEEKSNDTNSFFKIKTKDQYHRVSL